MSRSKLLRRLFWIGWVVWFFASLWLLMQLPDILLSVNWLADTLPSVNWTSEGNELSVTWYFLIWWTILILIWPTLFRRVQFTKILKSLCQAIPKLFYEIIITIVFLSILGIWLVGFILLMLPWLAAGFILLMLPWLAAGVVWSAGFVPLMVPALAALGALWTGFIVLMILALAFLSVWLILVLLHMLLFRWIRPITSKSRAGLDIFWESSIVWIRQDGLPDLLPLWRFVVQQWHEVILNLLPLGRFLIQYWHGVLSILKQYWHGVLSILKPLTNVLSMLGISTRTGDHETTLRTNE